MASKNISLSDLPFELQYFYSNECYVCRKTIQQIPVRRCSRCQMISYCDKEHQKKHYKLHKDFCQAVAELKKNKKCSHILQSLQDTEPETWKARKEKLILEVQSRVLRPLLPYERLAFIFPRCCLICHDSRQEFLIDCPQCPAISFCRKHNKDPSHSSVNCYWMDQCQMLDADLKGYTRTTLIDEIQSLISCIPMSEASKDKRALNLPKSMHEFVEHYIKSDFEIHQITKIHASELFTQSLTVVNAIETLKLNNYQGQNKKRSEMVIHVVGCDLEFDRPIFWEILLHLLPNLKTLKVLITDIDSRERIEPKVCDLCHSREKKLIVETLDLSYADYLDDTDVMGSDQSSDWKMNSKPNLVLLYDFNPLNENDENWSNILETWERVESPLVITTSHTEKTMKTWNKLTSHFEYLVNTFAKGFNNFASLRPRRDEDKFGTVYTKSNFWIICTIFRKSVEIIKKKCRKCGRMMFLDDKMICETCLLSKYADNGAQKLMSSNASNTYYPSSCYVCGSRPESLLSCKRCEMIFYCGAPHRKQHWHQHKDLCKVITEMQKELGSSNLFEGHKSSDPKTWLQAKINLIVKAQLKLERPLLNYEQEMFKFPKVCHVCHETDHRVLEKCFCEMSLCQSHKDSPSHASICKTLMYSQSYEVALAPLYSSPREDPLASFLQVSIDKMPHLTEFVDLPTAIESFIELFLKLDEEAKKEMESGEVMFSMRKVVISKFFSGPLTFISALEKMKKPGSEKLIIHVIRSCIEQFDTAIFWESLLHWFPTLSEIRVILIGPELKRETIFVPVCEKCCSYGYQFYLEAYGLLYEEYLQSEFYVKPDIVAGFNLDVYESDFGFVEWEESILGIAKQNIPFILTSTSKDRARRDNEKLGKILGKEVEYLWMNENPYKCLQPYRDYETEGVKYLNDFLTVYMDLSLGKEREESGESESDLKDGLEKLTISESGENETSKKKAEAKKNE